LASSHHLLLADSWARDAMRGPGATGISLNIQPTRPATEDPADVRVAHLTDLQMNARYLDPLFGRGYPPELVEHYQHASDFAFVYDGDLDAIHRPPDVLGVNYYRVHTITADPARAPEAGELPGGLGAWSFPPHGVPVTAMGWPIEPTGLTDLLEDLHRDYRPRRILITENGAAFDDRADADGGIDDRDRIAYLSDHLDAALRARGAGVPLGGYFVWSLLDNFEWAEGYSRRFGLVHVDFETQVRTPKASARWFRETADRAATLDPLGPDPSGSASKNPP
ncbi:MAG TPA: family 1 glycosylhydrolase, partial [Actinomycetota bacterium]|nr:family 1 glycosylhydrolase [Actinomycetota bacterium]